MQRLFYLLFAISGFAGLIYESIWSHYLKLFLGHAAYAQTLVLAIFMGGMALGAWICSRYGRRWRNLLLGYALVEASIGLIAMLFHPLFDTTVTWAYVRLLPALADPTSAAVAKWLLASLLILPQSVLLGMTFPLMTAGLIRQFPAHPGQNIASLYFCNSLGAAIGVLVSGFYLIDGFGLPGTIRIAGLLNFILALCVAYWARHWVTETPTVVAAVPTTRDPHPHPDQRVGWGDEGTPTQYAIALEGWGSYLTPTYGLLLWIAALTGAASFIYEIVWIRMLSLVLGSSTHAFELMLSVFILGLALGGLWIRRYIERLKQVLIALAVVQLCMGLLALLTLPVYNLSFDAMQWLAVHLAKTDAGYAWFNLGSHAISSVVMLPATFCAGMTLPLITYALLKAGFGERSIGAVYASNTVGAICGVMFATHVGMPGFGIKGLLLVGAALDLGLGLILLWYCLAKELPRSAARSTIFPAWINRTSLLRYGSVGLVFGSLGLALLVMELDLYKMSSGIYRYGSFVSRDEIEILYHKDGKVASVDLQRSKDGAVNIRTNGKVDANVQMTPGAQISDDEPTMVLAAAIPMAIKPDARRAAVIGIGSGLSSQTLLSNPNLELVDTIEIEPAMVEAANGFRPRVERVYSDPRSHIHIDDAKTFFSSHNKQYDIIISEPSNPWVSGIASLFTEEFYRFLPHYLSPDGILVQWVQLYEINIELLATIFKALRLHFKHYAIYAATDYDILIIASNRDDLSLQQQLFELAGPRRELNKIYVSQAVDLELRLIATRTIIDPLFLSYPVPANSDYAPILDLGAARARFLAQNVNGLVSTTFAALPVMRFLSQREPLARGAPSRSKTTVFSMTMFSQIALNMRNKFLFNQDYQVVMPDKYRQALEQTVAGFLRCEPTGRWRENLLAFAEGTLPFLNAADLRNIWGALKQSDCFNRLSPMQQDWLDLFHALAYADFKHAAGLAEWLLQNNAASDSLQTDFLLQTVLLKFALEDQRDQARQFWSQNRQLRSAQFDTDISSRLLMARLGMIN